MEWGREEEEEDEIGRLLVEFRLNGSLRQE